MGGGLMQLVAYGAQDIYLTGNPQITFFKVVYRRHTNFSMESIQQTWNGTATNAASRVTATISRNGDLVHRLFLETTTLSTSGGTTQINPGSSLISSVEVEIGGQSIDKHYGHWMETWAELTELNPSSNVRTVSNMTGTMFQNMSGMGGVTAGVAGKVFIPLQFWFCRNPGLALPLIALQYHEVKIILETNAVTALTGLELWADYIYLDTDERRRFAQVSHEYLIEQVQHETATITTGGTKLNFNHPVKELIWTSARGTDQDLTTLSGTFQLKLNGHDRFAARDFKYFTRTQVWQYHTGVGGLQACATSGTPGADDNIGVYSFALKPEEHQPSGTCNFSRIDTAQLTGDVANANIYAVNYNVLRIMSGMGGLAYSN